MDNLHLIAIQLQKAARDAHAADKGLANPVMRELVARTFRSLMYAIAAVPDPGSEAEPTTQIAAETFR